MDTIKQCIRCKEIIKDSANYIQFVEWNNQKYITEYFAHKTCWDLFLEEKKEKTFIRKLALGMAMKANKLMDKTGVMIDG